MEDYEELMLQISDVMREANRIRPIMSHEQAIKNIRGIVERHGKWIKHSTYKDVIVCSLCSHCNHGSNTFNFCPNCGARMDL